MKVNDIRSFFRKGDGGSSEPPEEVVVTSRRTKKRKKEEPVKEESSDEEDPLPKELRKKDVKRKSRVLSSDDDDEDFNVKKKVKVESSQSSSSAKKTDKSVPSSSSKSTAASSSSASLAKKKSVNVDPNDFFGGGAVNKNLEKKQVQEKEKVQKTPEKSDRKEEKSTKSKVEPKSPQKSTKAIKVEQRSPEKSRSGAEKSSRSSSKRREEKADDEPKKRADVKPEKEVKRKPEPSPRRESPRKKKQPEVIPDSDDENGGFDPKKRKSESKSKNSNKPSTSSEKQKKTVIADSDSDDDNGGFDPKQAAKNRKSASKSTNSTSTKPSTSNKQKRSDVIPDSDDDDEGFDPKEAAKKRKSESKSKTSTSSDKTLKTPDSKGKKEKEPVTPKTPLDDEQKKQRQANYAKFMAKKNTKPRNFGQKDIPEGTKDCLAGLTFVVTGLLDSLERDDVKHIAEKHGGRSTTAVSKKTTHLVLGEDPGESKLKKAKELGIPTIDEDGFLALIVKNSGGKVTYNGGGGGGDDEGFSMEAELAREKSPEKKKDGNKKKEEKKSPEKFKADKKEDSTKTKSPSKSSKVEQKSPEKFKSERNEEKSTKSVKVEQKSPEKSKSASKSPSKSPKVEPKSQKSPEKSKEVKALIAAPPAPTPSLMWVDKYKPTTQKDVCGQAKENSNLTKLARWLKNWFDNEQHHSTKVNPFKPNADPTGKTFKCALLSGSPGIGKTTCAHMAVKMLGWDYFEMNASDSRSKKGMKECIGDAVGSMTLNSLESLNRKHVLIMDEVDGMSGNEDRGGVQELIHLIKSSKIPIICICNDRGHQKIRSLANYCYDLRFYKPTLQELKGYCSRICFKEGVKIESEQLTQLIISADQDLRQILNQLEIYKNSQSNQVLNPKKDLRFGPWDVCRMVFSAKDQEKMSIHDKMGLFFQDYSLGPLFVQENYLKMRPMRAKNSRETMDAIAKSAASIANGDLVDRVIRSTQHWSLLPVQGAFSSYTPGELMKCQIMGDIKFPDWLGKNSNANKRARLLQQLHTHMHLEISGGRNALNLDYLPFLRKKLARGFTDDDDGCDGAVRVFEHYTLIREDLDSLIDLSGFPGMRNPMDKVDSKIKARFTRSVNKEIVLPYSSSSLVPVRKRANSGSGGLPSDGEEGFGEDGAEEEDDEEADKLEKDKMIKMKTAKKKASASGSDAGSSTSKGAGGKRKKK